MTATSRTYAPPPAAWCKLTPDAAMDEDYYLRVGRYLVTVSTRADYTGWAIFNGHYATYARITGGGACVDLRYDAAGDPDPAALAAAEDSAMAAAEAALTILLGKTRSRLNEEGARA